MPVIVQSVTMRAFKSVQICPGVYHADITLTARAANGYAYNVRPVRVQLDDVSH